ncbi:MAG: hypothetical protein HY696_07855 [Deltaproteobacteria bacterium]|nr:hypothetical protein [Deltaproteobacteria bacterium]
MGDPLATTPLSIRIARPALKPLLVALTRTMVQYADSAAGPKDIDLRAPALQARVAAILRDGRLDRIEAPALFRMATEIVGKRMQLQPEDVASLDRQIQETITQAIQTEQALQSSASSALGATSNETYREEIAQLRADAAALDPSVRDSVDYLIDLAETLSTKYGILDTSIANDWASLFSTTRAAAIAVADLVAEDTTSRQKMTRHLETARSRLEEVLRMVHDSRAYELARHRSARTGLSWENGFGLWVFFSDEPPSLALATALGRLEGELYAHWLGLKTFQEVFARGDVIEEGETVQRFVHGPFGQLAHLGAHFLLDPAAQGLSHKAARWRVCRHAIIGMAHDQGAAAWAAVFGLLPGDE